ncbi:porin [Stieleria varia]|uniref:Porin n=1 Tax=Stieleria varia TaxID=2528005 RepID=A0A5C5ZYJ9_9BACT|nr:porin [Stieleria varia]TWT92105.1 hypothetical protein Pla52n_64020 [Stieleria varia]
MKRKLLAALIMMCSGAAVSAADANHAYYQPGMGMGEQVAQVSHCDHDAGCGCEVPCDCDPGCGVEPGCGLEPADCGCEAPGCDGGCDGGCGGGCPMSIFGGDCDLGDPFSLFGEAGAWSAGGWVQLGYHTDALPLFNSRPDNVQLHQMWLYAEKSIDTSCGFDVGGRIDYVYGTDGPDTQAFGLSNGHWDSSWTNGNDYGHAIPQLYLEAGYGDLSFKVGHFYTLIGYEVVTAPDNFFYSHAYTMYNSEPFTHTGVLGTYNASDDVTVWGGYTLGWDSGFEDNGDSFLGGLSLSLTDDVSLTYAAIGGRFNKEPGERGYMQSLVLDVAVTDNLQYVFQTDYLDSTDANGATVRNTFDINQYAIYTINDCLAAGARFEWYNESGVYTPINDESDIYALTLGTNIKPHANVLIRPEVRFDWDSDEVAGLEEGSDQTTFGIDTILLF